MERSLRNRLTFGSMMLAALFGLLWVDSRAERWTQPWMHSHFGVVYGIGSIGLSWGSRPAIDPLCR